MILLTQYTLIFASILILVALGGCVSEHSGVINLGLEGIMVIGALGGALVMKYLPAGTSPFVIVILTMMAAIVAGTVYSSLLAVACINFKADQTIIGTALNLLGVAAATVAVKAINIAEDPNNTSSEIVYREGRQAFLTDIGGFELNVFMIGQCHISGTLCNIGSRDAHCTADIGGFELNVFMIIAFVVLIGIAVMLYKTRFGLRLMACGEHPQAADSVGINVYKMRWAGVLLSGALGGLGGIVYITAGVSQWMFENGVAGFGFLALAVMIFGQWKPKHIAWAALLSGFFRALGNVHSGFDFLKALDLPSGVYNMLPYAVSLIVLAFTSKRSRAPKAEGIPYDKGSR